LVVLTASLVVLLSNRPGATQAAHNPQTDCIPVIDHVEYTQATQEGNNPASPGIEVHSEDPFRMPPIPLVGWKTVTARFYVKLSHGCAAQGILQIDDVDLATAGWAFPSGYPTSGYGKSDNGPINITAGPENPTWDREDPNSTLNVTTMIVPSLPDLPITFMVELETGDGPYSPPLLWLHQGLTVGHMQIPTIVGVPVKYNGAVLTEEQKQAVRPPNVDKFHWAVWPLPDRRVDGGYGFFDVEVEHSGTLDTVLEANLKRKLCRWTEGGIEPDAIIGWIDPVARPGGRGKDNLHVAYAAVDASPDLNFAHEMGHVYNGPGHYDFKGLDQVGWDPLEVIRIPGFPWPVKDLERDSVMMPQVGFPDYLFWNTMVPHYEPIARRDTPYRSAVRCVVSVGTLPPIDYFHLTGHVSYDPQVAAEVQTTYLENGRVGITPEYGGAASIEVRDINATVIYSTTLDVAPERETFSVAVPAPQTAHEIALLHGGELQDTLVRTPNAPTLSVIEPQTGDTITSTLLIEWAGSDLDGDPLRAIVEYSADAGSTWMPLRVQTLAQTVLVPTDGLAHSDSAAVRVTVSDGLNTTSETVANLLLPGNHAPEVSLLSPAAGDTFKEDGHVVFVATAYDREDGPIPETDVAWTVSGNGHLVTGEGWTFSLPGGAATGGSGTHLPPGQYSATVTAEDSAGESESVTIPISIVAR
jgi:hypothetical protein